MSKNSNKLIPIKASDFPNYIGRTLVFENYETKKQTVFKLRRMEFGWAVGWNETTHSISSYSPGYDEEKIYIKA